MIYLDTGCLVKLYYPEPDSIRVIACIAGKAVCYTPLHELEFVNALRLKVYFKQATTHQVTAAWALVETDLKSGVLVSSSAVWSDVFQEAVNLAKQHTSAIGCRSLDILHCSVARILGVDQFISTDSRQKKLAVAMGLNLVGI